MEKSDLKTGMRVKTRDGCVYLVICDVLIHGEKDILFVDKNSGWISGREYKDNLMCDDNIDRSFDIVEIYTIDDARDSFQHDFINLDVKYLFWKRQEFTDEQKEIFKALKLLGFEYILCDKFQNLWATATKKEDKNINIWNKEVANSIGLNNFKGMFNFIKYEDEQLFEIPEV